MAKSISIREFVQLNGKLPEMIEAACVRGLRSAALRGVGEVTKQIDDCEPYSPVDTGAMRQSTGTEAIPDGATLFVNAPQAAWVEYGTRPHMPPLGPILVWVRRKFGLGAEGRRGKSRKKPAKLGTTASPGRGSKRAPMIGLREPPKQGPRERAKAGPRRTKMQRIAQNEKLAYAIAKKVQWKIYHHGTAPRGFFSKAMKVIVSKFAPKEIRHELKALEKSL